MSNGKSTDVEKLSSNDVENHDDALHRIRTAGSISISPELFEKLYLSPQNQVKGELRKTFGNPTPVAIGGFLLALTPLSLELLGFRGAGGLGAATVGADFFMGGLLMVTGGVGEWFLGNTFPTVVFMSFGSFWLTFAATLTPGYGAYAAYSTDPSNPAAGEMTTGFYASFGMFLISMAVLCFIYLIAAVRTNLVFFLIFLALVPAFCCLAEAFWKNAEAVTAKMAGDTASEASLMASALKLQHAGAGLAFAVCLLGWYLFLALMLAAVDFPFNVPLFDLSTIVKGASDKKQD